MSKMIDEMHSLIRENLMNLQSLFPLLKQTTRFSLKCHLTTLVVHLFYESPSLSIPTHLPLVNLKTEALPQLEEVRIQESVEYY